MTPTAPQPTVREHRIDTPQGQLHAKRWQPVRDEARALTPIVLLHDSLGCVELWRDFPPRLAQATGREVIAYDRLGFGRSDPYPGRLDDAFIHDEAQRGVSALREALQIDAFVAFGHSVGGGMAIGCAAQFPGDCRGVISESAQAFVEDRTLEGVRAAQLAFARPGQIERLRKYHGDKAAWVLSAWIDTWLAPAFAPWTLDDAIERVACPSLIVHGEQDEFGTTEHAQRIARLSPGPSRLHLLASCGHVPHREAADEVLATVSHWLHTALAPGA